MGIFSKSETPSPNIKRQTFDLSFANNLTMQLGKLYPTFVKEVLPNDTFKIGCNYGIRFMPTAFPIQSKLKFRTQFFYVRNRNLWKNFPNFWTGLGSQEQFPKVLYSKYCKNGELGDYLGLPTTLYGSVNKSSVFAFTPCIPNSNDGFHYTLYFTSEPSVRFFADCGKIHGNILPYNEVNGDGFFTMLFKVDNIKSTSKIKFFYYLPNGVNPLPELKIVNFNLDSFPSSNTTVPSTTLNCQIGDILDEHSIIDGAQCYSVEVTFSDDVKLPYIAIEFPYSATSSTDFITPTRPLQVSDLSTIQHYEGLNFTDNVLSEGNNLQCFTYTPSYIDYEGVDYPSADSLNTSYVSYSPLSNLTASDFAKGYVSALPFRAYESIYNAFYRDDRNNPYKVNGVVEPNVYLPTTDGGLDTNLYELHHANWEQDFLTTAVDSPQLGPAPLVGITSTGIGTFQSDDGSSHEVKFTTASDSDTITGVDFSDLASVPADVRKSAMNIATEGISISDFRSVNSYQRWLEVRLRSGLKYRDQIAGHFGITPSYAELDMPEFIGGFSSPISVSQVNQTSSGSDSDPLGSYAGQMFAVGTSDNYINFHCDEPGFIIGISFIVPTPIYSQVMPKHFLKFDRLDYFFPTFANLGYQPIKLSEVAPLQASFAGYQTDETFGYQQAWYDYKQSIDECHGLFRTSLSDFLLMRTFATVPSLQSDFLTVQQEQLNQIFTVNTDSDGNPVDPALGQLHFDCVVKREVPRISIPRLE